MKFGKTTMQLLIIFLGVLFLGTIVCSVQLSKEYTNIKSQEILIRKKAEEVNKNFSITKQDSKNQLQIISKNIVFSLENGNVESLLPFTSDRVILFDQNFLSTERLNNIYTSIISSDIGDMGYIKNAIEEIEIMDRKTGIYFQSYENIGIPKKHTYPVVNNLNFNTNISYENNSIEQYIGNENYFMRFTGSWERDEAQGFLNIIVYLQLENGEWKIVYMTGDN